MAYVFTGALVVGAAVSAIACAIAKLIIENEKSHSPFSIHTAVFVFFAAIATLSAQKGGTNAPPNGASPPNGNVELRMENGELRNLPPLVENEQIHNSPLSIIHSQFSMDDVIRGFLLESVTTNGSYSYAMPANGIRYDRWWHHGAYEDVFKLGLGGMAFPLNNELLDSLWVYSWGMAGAHLGDASNKLVATGVPMSAAPGISRFWNADAATRARDLVLCSLAIVKMRTRRLLRSCRAESRLWRSSDIG